VIARLALCAALIATSALAASDMPEGPKRFVGAWQIGHDGEGSNFCTINLDAAGVIGGAALRVPRACAKIVDRWDELYAWYVTPQNRLIFSDATRRAVYRFERLDPGVWASEGGDFERYLIYYKPPARPRR
jgi:hypothetical protein